MSRYDLLPLITAPFTPNAWAQGFAGPRPGVFDPHTSDHKGSLSFCHKYNKFSHKRKAKDTKEQETGSK
jgi:hypothetical protein